jgi:hypothetical protein
MKTFIHAGVIISLFLFGTVVSADTSVVGNISTSTVWAVDKSPYIVDAYVDILAGASLSVEPGGVVRFGPSGSLGVHGSLNAIGTQDLPINFTSSDGAQNNWRINFFHSTCIF